MRHPSINCCRHCCYPEILHLHLSPTYSTAAPSFSNISTSSRPRFVMLCTEYSPCLLLASSNSGLIPLPLFSAISRVSRELLPLLAPLTQCCLLPWGRLVDASRAGRSRDPRCFSLALIFVFKFAFIFKRALNGDQFLALNFLDREIGVAGVLQSTPNMGGI